LMAISAWYVPFRLKRLLGMKKWVRPMQIAIFLLLAGFYAILPQGLYITAGPVIAWA
jgi:hypothetical protein